MARDMRIMRRVAISPQAAKYLQKSIDRPPKSIETLESLQLALDSGLGYCYEFIDDKFYGVIVISFQEQYLNVNIMGGRELKEWRDALVAFLKGLETETGTKLDIVSRKGLEKIFPELKQIGVRYTFR